MYQHCPKLLAIIVFKIIFGNYSSMFYKINIEVEMF